MKIVYLVWKKEFYGATTIVSVHSSLLGAQQKLQEKFDEIEKSKKEFETTHFYMEERQLEK